MAETPTAVYNAADLFALLDDVDGQARLVSKGLRTIAAEYADLTRGKRKPARLYRESYRHLLELADVLDAMPDKTAAVRADIREAQVKNREGSYVPAPPAGTSFKESQRS